MSPAQRAIAALVAALVVVAIVAVVLIGANQPTAIDPGPSVSESPTTTPLETAGSTASADPSVPDETETVAVLREIEEQVIAIRGLPAAEIGPPDILSRAELREELEELFAEEYPPEEQERDNLALRALGLLEPDQDVVELQLQLLGDQVLGFYDDIDKRMVVVTDAGLDAEARLTYAHEYTHALQDAAFGLDSLETDAVGEDDRSLARTALIEGDATVTMLSWALNHLSQEELLEIGAGIELPDTTGIPTWMVAQLEFPYNEGSQWAGALAVEPVAPDFSEINAAYDDPPESTEQIIDLQKWLQREDPVAVPAPDLELALGDGWEEVDETPIGQASIRIILQYFGVDSETAVAAADGWGGDRAVIATGPGGAFAVSWRLTWDGAADGEEFAEAYETAVAALDFPASVRVLEDGDVLVSHASSEGLLAQVEAAGEG